jgi:hypothetical protein
VTSAAWLSSARVVNCRIYFRNERNPAGGCPAGEKRGPCVPPLPFGSLRTAPYKGEVGWTTSNPHGLDPLGITQHTMWGTMSGYGEIPRKSPKPPPGTDCALQLEHMKQESRVIVDQHATVNRHLGGAHTAHHFLEGHGHPSPRPGAPPPCPPDGGPLAGGARVDQILLAN